MYKKLSNNFTSFSSFLTATAFISCVCMSMVLSGFFDLTSVFAMTANLDNTFILFSVENSVDTEILARRIGSGLATAGLGGVGTGIGLVFSGLIKGFSRNPSLKDDLFSYAIFGFALTEAIGLFALMMAFMLLYA